MKEEAVEFQEGDQIPFETGKRVKNWAETFESITERFYTPSTESEVVQVDPFPSICSTV
jgi:hypothetical protein